MTKPQSLRHGSVSPSQTNHCLKSADEFLNDVPLEATSNISPYSLAGRSSPLRLSPEPTSSDGSHQSPEPFAADPFLTTSQIAKTSDGLFDAALRSSSSRYVTPIRDRFHLPHSDDVDDSRNLYSSNYNRHLHDVPKDHTTPTRCQHLSAAAFSSCIPNPRTQDSSIASVSLFS